MQYSAGGSTNGDCIDHDRQVLHLICRTECRAAVEITLVESMLSETLRGSRQRLIRYTKIMLFHYRHQVLEVSLIKKMIFLKIKLLFSFFFLPSLLLS